MSREFSDYYVAFIDVLGFKQLLSSNASCQDVYSVFEDIRNGSHTSIKVNGENVEAFEHVHNYIMSDSIVLYIRDDIANALMALVYTCLYLQHTLIAREKPILLRGGISRGKLYVDDDIIFGKALSTAYELESKVSITPRIILNKDLLNEKVCDEKTEKFSWWRRMATKEDEDELCFVHYCSIGWVKERIPEFYDHILTLCQRVLNSTYDKSLREKYLWLKKYVINECKHQCTYFKTQSGASEFCNKWNLYI